MKTKNSLVKYRSFVSGRKLSGFISLALLATVLLSAAAVGAQVSATAVIEQMQTVRSTTTVSTVLVTTSTIWRTATATILGVLTTVQYTTSTSTVTINGLPDTNTKLLLHMDGTDGSQAFVDSSSETRTVTANRNAQISSAQSKFGGASGLFDGRGDYLSVPDSADWAFGNGDFTIDFWVRFNALPATGQIQTVVSQLANGNNLWWIEVRNAAGTYYWSFFQYAGGFETISFKRSTALSANTWYHVAIVRSGNSWYLFQDGTLLGTIATVSTAVADFAGSLYVGQVGNGAWYLNGWLDEARVSKGVARWTSNFTPPAASY